MNLPLVKEVVVREDNKTITAEIFPDMGEATAMGVTDVKGVLEQQIGDINRGLPRYKHILNVRLRDKEFEKTTTKKIMRYKLNGGNI